MLDRLEKKFEINRQRIRIVKGSYLTLPLGVGVYDYVMSVMSLHHLPFKEKLGLYRRIHNALRYGGTYVEGDYIVSEEEERRFLDLYRSVQEELSLDDTGSHHIDIPFSERTQQQALNEAGFADLQVMFSTQRSNVCVAVRK
jgi:tRNA (cmo5U34)-methyltransferase